MSSTTEGISVEQVEAILECPICFEVPQAPIFNCQTGHTVCGDCRKKVTNCPLCRQGITNARNFIAETLAGTLKHRCPYSTFGCEAYVRKSPPDEHMKLCNFRPVGCQVHPCVGQRIAYASYLDHLKNAHRVAASTSSEVDTTARSVTQLLMPHSLTEQQHKASYAISGFGHTFLQYTQAVGGKVWFWVSLLGTPEEARGFRVTLTLSSEEKQLKNIWIGSVHSVFQTGDDIYLNGLCMVMTEECLKTYVYHQSGSQFSRLQIEIEKVCTSEVSVAGGNSARDRDQILLMRRCARAFKASSQLIGVISFALFCIAAIYYLSYALFDYVGRNVRLQLIAVVILILTIIAHSR